MQVTGLAKLRLITVNWLFCIQLNLCFFQSPLYCKLSSLGGSAHFPEQSSEQQGEYFLGVVGEMGGDN